MGEGAILKKKFDDIFESTRYSKALEAIQKAKKENASKAKDIKAEVAECSAHLRAAHDMRRGLEISMSKKDAADRELEQFSDELAKLENRLERCQDITRKWADAEKEVQDLQNQAENLKKRVADKRVSLEVEYDDSDDQLKSQIDNFDETMIAKDQELRKIV